MDKKHHKRISSFLEYENPYMKIYKNNVLYSNGEVKPYWILKRPDFVLTIPLIDSYNTVLVGQYRIPIEKYSWEFPMGFARTNTLLEMAAQELKEETGFTSDNWKKIGSLYVAPGHNTQQCHIFVACDVKAGKPTPEPYEFLNIKNFKIQDVKKMIETGKIFEGPTIVAFHFLENYLNK